MELETAHNFEQIIWVQLNQFNLRDLQEALNSFISYEELHNHSDLIKQYYQNIKRRRDYIRMIFETKCYQFLERWIMDEIHIFNYNHNHKVQDDRNKPDNILASPPQSTHKKESPMPSLYSVSSDPEEDEDFYSL